MEKKRLSKEMRLSVLAFALFVTGLIVVIPSAETSASKGGRKEYLLKQYYPLSEGKTWNYLQTYEDGHKNYEVHCIGGSGEVDDVTANREYEFDSGELEYYNYAYNCLAWTKEGLKTYKGVCSDGTYNLYDPPAIVLPRMIRIGEAFSSEGTRTYYDVDGNETDSWEYSIELTLEGVEDIEVPAGSFDGCLKFSGNEVDEGEEADLTLWLAPGIGEVKRELGTEVRELISFTEHNTTYHPGD